MALVSHRVDDLDGRTKVTGESTTLSLNGRTVSIDLSPKHVEELDALLAPYFEKGVEVHKNKATASKSDSDRNAEIRQWAQTNGHNVSDRGRLAQSVVDAFNEWEATQLAPADESAPATV
jgi:hypothetical protein